MAAMRVKWGIAAGLLVTPNAVPMNLTTHRNGLTQATGDPQLLQPKMGRTSARMAYARLRMAWNGRKPRMPIENI